MKKTAVIIIGAGGPIAWGGPFTSSVTKELFQNKEFLTKNGQNLAEFVRDVLAGFYKRDSGQIHFEFIINALESIADYLTDDATRGGPPQFTGSKPAWFSLNDAYKQIENYEYIPNREGQGFLKNLAKPSDTPIMVYENNYKRFYILKAIEHYLQIIRNCIGRYDLKEAISKFKSENEEFLAFYQLLKSQGYSVRFYTTNYDDLVPLIFELLGEKPLYRGFDIDKTGKMFPNIKKILLSPDADTYYNLHGNIYWEINTNEKFEPSFMYAPGIQRAAPMAHAEYTNPSERTIIYNIITGFNKLQKVSIEPLKAFFTCLSNDAMKADLIATIGYSYGDTHVNRSLGYGVKHGKAKFLHITKSDNFFGSSEFIGMQDHMMNKKNYSTDFDYKNPWITAKDNTAMIYINGFQDFLTKKEWYRLKEFI